MLELGAVDGETCVDYSGGLTAIDLLKNKGHTLAKRYRPDNDEIIHAGLECTAASRGNNNLLLSGNDIGYGWFPVLAESYFDLPGDGFVVVSTECNAGDILLA